VARTWILATVVWLALVFRAARAAPAAPMPCKISVDQHGQPDGACLPALSADGARVAVPERCGDRGRGPCLTIAILSLDGEIRNRIEIAPGAVIEASLRRVNRLLADGRFAPMSALKLPFSEYDLNVMTFHVSDVVIHFGGGTLLVDRDDCRLVTLDLPVSGACTKPWISALFLHDKTHTLAVAFEYHDQPGCSHRPLAWRVVRYP
jgi:hypothetical protein